MPHANIMKSETAPITQGQFDRMTISWRQRRERARILMSQLIATKTIVMRNHRAIISFTFDDFPRSAVTNGAEILRNYGFNGTFYFSGSMCGETISNIDYYNLSDLIALNAQGHEIGCHTFDHLPVSKLRSNILHEEIDRNASFLAERIPGLILRNFAYPFGSVSPFHKLWLQRKFASCRSTIPGLNFHQVDLGFLRAVRISKNLTDPHAISALVRQAVAKRAWLIFYTHDVNNVPSQHGCTREIFEYAVRTAADSKADVLTVGNAIGAIQNGSDETNGKP
jgi:peptidoglycan/xylan/chitin deacetylase (PgdA/CDA1 family)